MAEEKSSKVTVEMPERKESPPAPRTGGFPSAFGQMEREMQRLFDTFLSRRGARPWQWEMPEMRLPFEQPAPRVDVIDRENEVVVRAELPGVERQDVDVSLGDGTITIKATAHRESSEEKGEYFRREISAGELMRTVALPSEVDADGARASFKDGHLEVTLPKAERAKRRQIPIR